MRSLHFWLGAVASALPPLSTEDPSSFFAAVTPPVATPGPALAGKSGPKPTNAWWTNLGIATSEAESNVFQMPYVVLAESNGLLAMQPYFIQTPAMQDFDPSFAVVLGADETLSSPEVHAWDELSVTVGWGAMKSPLVRGSPYLTAEYEAATPKVTSQQMLQSEDVLVDGVKQPCDGSTLTGSSFELQFLQSDSAWTVFAGQGSWRCEPSPFSLTATAPITGAVRLALSNPCVTGSGAHHCEGGALDTSAWSKLLHDHAGRYPVNASVDVAVDGDVGTLSYKWGTASLEGWTAAELLQLAWPVHTPLLRQQSQASVFRDLRGPAAAVVADEWQLDYPLFPDVGFAAARPVPDSAKAEILAAIREDGNYNASAEKRGDKDFDLPLNYQLGAGDTYFSGKMVARLARIVAVADELGEASEPYFAELLSRLRARVETWLDSSASANPFLYDKVWGGVVACGCIYDNCRGKCTPHCSNPTSPPESCPALSDPGQNFGNGFYNDHHFHYGYWVYAAAVVAKHDAAWEQKWRQPLLAIIRDYGNPSDQDPYFPVARHKDWFLGLSWAGGIPQAYRNGRNQESTSEAVHAYYALYLYGKALDAPFASTLRDVGRVLTAMETHAADVYWHVRPDSPVYSGMNYEHGVVGILWTHMAQFQTFFGGAAYFVHGIQQMPYTPVSEALLPADWVAQVFPEFQSACDSGCEAAGWSWLVCLEQAVLDADAARSCLAALPKDVFTTDSAGANGNSLTSSLHWIATRSTSPAPPSPTPSPPPSPSPTPTPTPSPSPTPTPSPSPTPTCQVGDSVACPSGGVLCAGNSCCPDGSTCPSADSTFSGCPKAKKEDCTGTGWLMV